MTAQERLAAAAAAARQASRAVDRTSRAKLDRILRLPPRQRFMHLDDIDLTPTDRGIVRRSVMAKLERPRSAPWPGWWAKIVHGMRTRSTAILAHPAAVFAICVGAAWLALAWWHTPRVGYSETAQPVFLYGERGFVTAYTFPPRTWIAVERMSGGQALVRLWMPGQGYLHGIIPLAGLTLVR